MIEIYSTNVRKYEELEFSPEEIWKQLPLNEAAIRLIHESRLAVINQLNKKSDKRLLVICGPCSIHNEDGILEYTEKFFWLRDKVKDTMNLVMRAYFEKSRTGKDWNGFINDPYLDDTYDINNGILRSYSIARKILHMGVPLATEFIEPVFPPYMAHLFTVAAIGARTIQSPTQRRFAGGMSPIGIYKNSTSGNIQVAVDAILTAKECDSYPTILKNGKVGVVYTTGNQNYILVLRGSDSGTNYDKDNVLGAMRLLQENELLENVLIDCSHKNSLSNPEKQLDIWREALNLRLSGIDSMIGMMLESYLEWGNQKRNSVNLRNNLSITDACIDWNTTKELVLSADKQLRKTGN